MVGSPGGRTIINTVMQVALNLMAFEMPVQQAVNAARIHHQWLPNAITMERDGFGSGVADALKAKGHVVRMGSTQGTAHSIAIDPKTGKRLGAPDPRDRDAGASGHN